MTAFQKLIIALVMILGLFYFFIFYKPDMTVVYPDDCTFVIDSAFSRAEQLEIKDFIDRSYKKSKKPVRLLPRIEANFHAIKSIVIDMQNPESLNFTIQAHKPLFLVNNQEVVCENEQVFSKEIFDEQRLAKLENIYLEKSLNSKNVRYLIQFFNQLTDYILKNFSIRWIDRYNIWLDYKQGDNFSLLVNYTMIPTNDDIVQCQKLQEQFLDKPCKDKWGKPCKNNKKCVCDIRFDQQIILCSKNKGE